MDGQYMVRRRLRDIGREGQKVNIPYGTILECKDGLIYWKGQVLCNDDCKLQKDYLIQANDSNPKGRAELIDSIFSLLTVKEYSTEQEEKKRLKRWEVLWQDEKANTFRRQDYTDYWLWTNKFFDAPYIELNYIYNLIRRY